MKPLLYKILFPSLKNERRGQHHHHRATTWAIIQDHRRFSQTGTTEPADLMVSLINISIKTSRPLKRWQHSAQIMLIKRKGKYIENLRII